MVLEEKVSRIKYCAKASQSERNKGLEHCEDKILAQSTGAKNASKETDEYLKENTIGLNTIKKMKNFHPTIKPLKLMRYLVRLVSPPGNPIILDPFAGSCTTGLACIEEDVRFILIEKEKDYCEIGKQRIINYV